MGAEARTFSDECSTAYLPGIGFLVEPSLMHYQASARWLRRNALESRHGAFLQQLEATIRRLQWTPARLRAARS